VREREEEDKIGNGLDRCGGVCVSGVRKEGKVRGRK